ncbi:hypothetical protein M9435_005611 [Picochlorum sp. BPE23]|nr:hypothetical protein M9435_005611 [Picochlorum sp. BPE23]
MQEEARCWYYVDKDNTPQGPVTAASIREILLGPSGNARALVWRREFGQEWKPVSAVPEIIDTGAHVHAETTGKEGDEHEAFVDDDGTRYEWDAAAGKYIPSDMQQVETGKNTGYSVNDMVYPDGGVGPSDAGNEDVIRRKAALLAAQERSEKGKQARARNEQWFDAKKNTSVYVQGLPQDVTVQEMEQVFSKCGVIKIDPETNGPRIKLYRDNDVLKGDGLVTYLKAPSVQLAIDILDGTPLRYGLDTTMSISEAKFEQKGNTFVKKDAVSKKRKKQIAEMQERKALGWKGFDDKIKPELVTVVLKNMFTLDEMAGNADLKHELQEDVRDECNRIGPVDKVRVFHTNPEGVIVVKYKNPDDCKSCIKKMHGRWFGGRQITAEAWDGITDFLVKQHALEETEEEQQARLERYAAELES